MDWGALIQMISDASNNTGQFVSGIASYSSKRQAIDRQEQAFKEEDRRTELEMKNILADSEAGLAASGLSSDSASIRNYLGFMETEMQKQADWTREQHAIDISNARTASDWELGGSIFLWMTGGSSKSMSMFGGVSGSGEKEQKKVSKEISKPDFGDEPKDPTQEASAQYDQAYMDEFGVLT